MKRITRHSIVQSLPAIVLSTFLMTQTACMNNSRSLGLNGDDAPLKSMKMHSEDEGDARQYTAYSASTDCPPPSTKNSDAACSFPTFYDGPMPLRSILSIHNLELKSGKDRVFLKFTIENVLRHQSVDLSHVKTVWKFPDCEYEDGKKCLRGLVAPGATKVVYISLKRGLSTPSLQDQSPDFKVQLYANDVESGKFMLRSWALSAQKGLRSKQDAAFFLKKFGKRLFGLCLNMSKNEEELIAQELQQGTSILEEQAACEHSRYMGGTSKGSRVIDLDMDAEESIPQKYTRRSFFNIFVKSKRKTRGSTGIDGKY